MYIYIYIYIYSYSNIYIYIYIAVRNLRKNLLMNYGDTEYLLVIAGITMNLSHERDRHVFPVEYTVYIYIWTLQSKYQR